ncbi:MAG: CRTAC1 family protein [Bacteroidota bacterium]|nr:CRTAC1 family protein [Bacteroidota bacterium]
MNWQKRIPKIITIIIFAGLLIGTALSSVKRSFHPSGAKQKELSLKKYGFYLEPVNKETGIDFRHLCPQLDPKIRHIEPQIASMGASVSIVDYDKDGWEDIYFTNSRDGSQNALYHNLRNGKFENVAAQLGIADVNKEGTGVSMGAIWGDYDNDGYDDLFLYKWGKPELFHNVAGKGFVNVTEGSGLPAWVNANSAIWLDFNNDGLLDLFLGGYYSEKFDLSHLTTTKIMPESFRYANNGGRKYLLENMGNGKFKDVTSEYGLNSTKWTLAAASADFNGDGYPDLFIANDYNVNELYINDKGKKFTEVGRQAGIGNIPKSGMSVSFGDINNKGILGIYNTTITEKGILIQDNNYWEPEKDQTDNSYPRFVNLAQLAGINNAGWSYGAQFGDLNNDGNMDLYVANGFISAKKGTSYWYDYSKVTGGNSSIIEDANNWPDMKGKSQSGYEQNKIWLNQGNGSFEDVSDEVCPYATYDSRSVAMADLFNNGKLDIIVANQNNIPLVYKNDLENGNHWIEIDLQGTLSNADAVGAKVILEWNGMKQVQVVTGGMGFSSQNEHRLHFGIGKSTKVDHITINWPSGKQTVINNPEIDKLLIVKETNGKEEKQTVQLYK